MPFIDAPSNFYLGRRFDPQTGEVVKEEAFYYDSRDLTTHGVIVGMTGSGKTGMALGLLEEAILDGIPVLMVDPKGDLGNLMLTFPNFQPDDFQPWVQEDEARRDSTDVATLAAKKAEQWKTGLADWDISPERMEKLRQMADITIYTPGSESGVPISILASLRAPKGDFDANAEALREQIQSTVSAILSLAGITADPMQDPRHVLMSNIFEQTWRKGEDLTLESLIMQVQKPPFDKLGVMPVEDFFPSKDRFGLAMKLNAIISAPTFAAWLNGAPMDMQSLLYTPEGKPRVAIFYIAHLDDAQRMFVMTLILETMLNWTRQQAGTGSLRALLYIDEIYGFFPPIANPPSKDPMLRMLKQARAFGVGVLMATQNPIDLDYKGLANMGTWFIGRLQSDGDRDRVIAGLQEAASAGDMDLAEVKQLIANIKSRTFLVRNIHSKAKAQLFSARWAMSYLAGPFTRQQISLLMTARRSGLTASTASAEVTQAGSSAPAGYSTQPPVMKAGSQVYLPLRKSAAEAIGAWEQANGARADSIDSAEAVYVPLLLGQVRVAYDDSKARVRAEQTYAFRVTQPPTSGYVRWAEYKAEPVDKTRLDAEPRGVSLFAELPPALADQKRMKALSDDLLDTIYKDYGLTIRFNKTYKVYGEPDEDVSAFEARVRQMAREQRDAATDALTQKYETKLDRLEERIKKKESEKRKDEARVAEQTQSSVLDAVGGALTMLMGGRARSSSLTRIGKAAARTVGTSSAKEELSETEAELAELEAEKTALAEEMQEALNALQAEFDESVGQSEDYTIKPTRKDITLDLFGLAWVPHYRFMSNGQERLAAGDA